MNITQKMLTDAADEQIISQQQCAQLVSFCQAHPNQSASFNFTQILYYFGGLLAIGAMTLFMTLGWESFGGIGIVALSLVYAVIGLKLTHAFQLKSLFIPAGISATFVVALTPLFIYGLQHMLGVWPDDSVYKDYHKYIKWHWLYMELGTLAVGAIMLWRYKFAFLVMPVAATLWYLSMELVQILEPNLYSWKLRSLVSMYFGLLMTGLAFWVDIRSRKSKDYAFWLYLFGVIAFWGGLSSQSSDSELAKFVYFSINLSMIVIGSVLVRRVFVIFGALGCAGYVGHLAYDLFKDSWLFPISLTLIGFGIIYLGILWQKHHHALTHKLRSRLPLPLQELIESKNYTSSYK